jgi:hypothetical protein
MPWQFNPFTGSFENKEEVQVPTGGAGGVTGTQDILNNSAGVNIADFTFNGVNTKSVIIQISMARVSDIETRIAKHELSLIWNGINWVGGTTVRNEFSNNDIGVDFIISTNMGNSQVNYNSDLVPGVYDQTTSQFSYVISEVQ